MSSHQQVDPAKAGVVFKYDPLFKGPKLERKSTDVVFMIIFSIVIVAWMAMGFWAIGSSDFIKTLSNNAPINNPNIVARLVIPFKVYMLPVFIGFLLTMVAAMVLIFAMRWISAIITWALIVVFHVLLLTAAIFGFVLYAQKPKGHDLATGNLAIGIFATILFIIFFLIVFLARKRIKFAIALIKESSRAVASMWSTVLFPLVPAIFQIAVIEFAAVVSFCLSSLHESGYSSGAVNFLQTFNVIACLWDMLFISALSQLSLAGAFSTWYWTYNKDNVPYFVMTMSATRSVIYHSGTAAFGALLLTVCRVLRMIVNARSSGGACCALCLSCLLSSLEDFVKRFNQNAYIMCAIHGKGLCASALSAYQLIFRNILRIMATDVVTSIVFGFCKLFLAVGAGCFGWIYFSKQNFFLVSPVFPVFLLVVGGYLIGSAFFSVYSIAVDTIVLCALEDAERNDGSSQRPYYMSHRLMKILAKDSPANVYRSGPQGEALSYNTHF